MIVKINLPDGRQLDYDTESRESLWQCLRRYDVLISGDCDGHGRCGQCRGTVSTQGQSPKERLLCRYYPTQSVAVTNFKLETQHTILTEGTLPHFEYRPAVTKRILTAGEAQQASKQLGLSMDEQTHQWTGVYDQGEIFSIEPGDTTAWQYGLAVDIGTTTVVVTLVNLLTGEQLATESQLNQQGQYGSDVLTRITHVMDSGLSGLDNLQTAVINTIKALIQVLRIQTGVNSQYIYQMVIAGNPVMLHLLLGINPEPLGRSPYELVVKSSQNFQVHPEWDWSINSRARIITLPMISAYVGADVVCGAYVAELDQQDQAIVIDIGTNGEMILASNQHLLCCSTAAGPAFEGMNITSGMKASSGAIEEVLLTPEGAVLSVISNTEPIGLCGSGVLAALREGLRYQLVNERGRIIDPQSLAPDDDRLQYIEVDAAGKRRIRLAEGVYLSQQDIRQVQLAKGAIMAGIEQLLVEAQTTAEAIQHVYIAGQFGAHIDESSLIETGILPKAFKNKLHYLGNTSHSGAYMALMSLDVRQDLEVLSQRIEPLELSLMDDYQRRFVRHTLFEKRG